SVRESMARVGRARVGVAASRVDASKREAQQSKELAGFSERLQREGLNSKIADLQAFFEAQQRDDRLKQTTAELEEMTTSRDLEERQAALRELGLSRQIADAEAELRLGQAAIKTLELTIQRRTIRALASGYLGDVAPLTVGANVAPGRPLATI